MPGIETGMGGSREVFPETALSMILACPNLDAPEWRARMERLLSAYWRPVYAYVRTAWGKTVEDSKDLTQAFFSYAMEGGLIKGYDPAKGRFRGYLREALKHFLLKVRRDGERLKRGGGQAIASLDVVDIETDGFLADARASGPDRVFDRQWAADVMDECVTDLKRQLQAEGKEVVFGVYEALDLADEETSRPTYEDLAARLGISVPNVGNYLQHARARLRQMILLRISDGVTSRDELMADLQALFSSM